MFRKTVFAILAACPLILAAAPDQTPGLSSGQTPPATAIANFRRQCAEKSLSGTVALEGTVTLAQGGLPDNPFVFYLQDDTGGVSVSPPRDIGLRVSDRASVVARCSLFDQVEVEAAASEIRNLGRTSPVRPQPTTVADALAGRGAGVLVRVRGTVAAASVGDTRDRLTLEEGGKYLGVYIRRPLAHPSVLSQMSPPGSEVEVDGILIETTKGGFQVRLRQNGDLHLLRAPRPWLLKNLAVLALIAALAGAVIALWIFTLQRSLQSQTRQIRKLLAEAQAASELKSQFLANVSHEIRTPIHGILGLQSMVLDSPLPPEQREQLRIANEATRGLRALLDDLLDLSRIEAGRLTLTPEPVHLAHVVQHCAAQFLGRAVEKNIRLHTELHPELPAVVSADATRLRQILTNLVSNAVKFTSAGEVVVLAEPIRRNGDRARIRFTVRDSGIGIAPGKLEHIFDTFRQADGSISRRYGGSGLGLSIAAKLTDLMQGRIHVSSELHAGSVFTVELEFPVLEQAPAASAASPESDQWPVALRILLAEDNPVNQMVALRLLQKDEHSVCIAANGREAVDRYRGGEFDLVLMDVQMPEMDGLEAARAIRSMESELGRTSPIIALSAHTMTQEAERCFAVGMDDFLGKPFHHTELRAVIRRAMSNR